MEGNSKEWLVNEKHVNGPGFQGGKTRKNPRRHPVQSNRHTSRAVEVDVTFPDANETMMRKGFKKSHLSQIGSAVRKNEEPSSTLEKFHQQSKCTISPEDRFQSVKKMMIAI